jgi:hypothetical protein
MVKWLQKTCSLHFQGEKIRDMLQRDLDIRMAELSREKNSNEKLQSLIEVHIATHKELVGLLEQTPTAVASQLIKEQGILKKVENSVNASQNKYVFVNRGEKVGIDSL